MNCTCKFYGCSRRVDRSRRRRHPLHDLEGIGAHYTQQVGELSGRSRTECRVRHFPVTRGGNYVSDRGKQPEGVQNATKFRPNSHS